MTRLAGSLLLVVGTWTMIFVLSVGAADWWIVVGGAVLLGAGGFLLYLAR